jgi:hypothetical protein
VLFEISVQEASDVIEHNEIHYVISGFIDPIVEAIADSDVDD